MNRAVVADVADNTTILRENVRIDFCEGYDCECTGLPYGHNKERPKDHMGGHYHDGHTALPPGHNKHHCRNHYHDPVSGEAIYSE